jgi:hypothetical protein
MSPRLHGKPVSKTHNKLKWQLTALSGVLSTGLIVLLES